MDRQMMIEAYNKASKQDRDTLERLFPDYNFTENAFIRSFEFDELSDMSKKLFGWEYAMQIGVNDELGEYQNRCFWFDGDFFEKPIFKENEWGNYILKLHKK